MNETELKVNLKDLIMDLIMLPNKNKTKLGKRTSLETFVVFDER